MSDRPWTPEDDAELLAFRAHQTTLVMMAKKLGRSEAEIVRRLVEIKAKQDEADNQ